MNNNRIFPNSSRTNRARENAERAVRTLQKMQRALRYISSHTPQQVQSMSRQLASDLRGVDGRLPGARQLVQMAESIERMARENRNGLVSQIIESLGQSVNLSRDLLRSREASQSLQPFNTEIQRAMDLLGQFSGLLTDNPVSPEQAGGRRLPDWAESSNVPQAPRPPSPNRPPSSAGSGGNRSGGGSGGRGGGHPPAPDYTNGPHRNVRVLSDGRWEIRAPGYHRVLDPNDPVLTGQMRRVESSNVYSIGFDFNFDLPLKSNLIIRYKQKDRYKSSGTVGGPTYEYRSVHPDWFTDLVDAGSKGKWVWDQLRIRGTVAGHQYDYNLIRAAQGYLPRRAIVSNGVQQFRRRMRQTERGDTLVSPLPNQNVGRYSPTAHRPNVGNMDRGRVERGTPNRGR